MEQAYHVSHLPDGTIQIDEGFVRSFLVTGSAKALLIDTGNGTGDLQGVVRSLTDLPVILVNTHADGDHMGCNHQFDCAYLHEEDFSRARRSVPEDYPLLPVRDGEIFDLGGRKLEVLHIPGHTHGSIALLDRENRVLFSGDSVQNGSIFMFGEGRDMQRFHGSIQKLLGLRHLFDNVYPCHNGIPVSPEVLTALHEGAEKALKGTLSGTPVELHGNTVRECDVGGAAFYLPI